jgi:hypothetical protein
MAGADLPALLQVHRLLAGHGLQHLVYGGWGLDIICGAQSRPHRDVDLFCWQHDYHRLRSVLISYGCTVYELPGRHLAVKEPFRADVVFLADRPGTGQIVGTGSVFQVRVPRRGLRDWACGVVAGHRLPVGCVELVVRLSGYSPHSHRSDRALVAAITAGCDQSLLSEIEHIRLPYDPAAGWTRCEPGGLTPGWPARAGSPPRSRAAGR